MICFLRALLASMLILAIPDSKQHGLQQFRTSWVGNAVSQPIYPYHIVGLMLSKATQSHLVQSCLVFTRSRTSHATRPDDSSSEHRKSQKPQSELKECLDAMRVHHFNASVRSKAFSNSCLNVFTNDFGGLSTTVVASFGTNLKLPGVNTPNGPSHRS